MKKLLLGATALFLMVSCGGKDNQNNITSDSATTLDLAENTTSQQTDSLATDSISTPQEPQEEIKAENRENSKKFYAAIPNYKKFFSETGLGDLDRYLKSLGYKGSTRTVSTFDGPELRGNFKFEDGEKSISIQYRELMGGMDSKITIVGDEQTLSDFYKKAKKLKGEDDWWQCDVYKKGNTVFIEGGMD